MASQDLHNIIKTTPAFEITATASDTEIAGIIIDTYENESVEFILFSGDMPVAADTYTPKLYEGDDVALSDAVEVTTQWLIGTPNIDPDTNAPLPYTAIADATFLGSTPDANLTKRIGYSGKKRYVRLNIVVSAWTAAGTIGAVAVLERPWRAPTKKDGV